MTKPQGRHKYKRLTDLKIKKLTTAKRYADGDGLYLVVQPSGSKNWVLRTMIQGKRKDIGLGGYPSVSLSEARKQASLMREQARLGKDPVAIRQQERRIVPTFAEAAISVHANNEPTWKNPKAAAQWLTTLKTYAFPFIGNMAVDTITRPDIVKVLKPIWVEKHPTAYRVRQRMAVIFEWAITHQYRTTANPVSGVQQGLPKVRHKASHFKALSYEEISEFVLKLQKGSQSVNVRYALEFLILTACRSSEVRFAKWSEIDETNHLWTLPPEKMKAGREHVVPLGSRCMALLEAIKPISVGKEYVFPSPINWSKPMSDSALSKTVKKGLGYPVTVHGFRSTFRDWVSETTDYREDIVEMALAHMNKNKVEAAYKRGNLLKKRRVLMQDWEDYVLEKKKTDKVVS